MVAQAYDPIWRQMKRRRASADTILRFFMTASGLSDLRPPIPIRHIAHWMQIMVVDSPTLECAGAVDSNPQQAVIWLRQSDHETRKRFTLAHEIGHLILHPEGTMFRDEAFTGSTEESQANGYGAGLLMPLWLVTPYARAADYDVKQLAEAFEVSRPAMQVRLLKMVGL